MGKPIEPEFEQALNEIKSCLAPVFKDDPAYEELFEVIQIPERVVQFRVTWEDDQGKCRVNTGYRVQFSSVLGPYKGGLRFHPSVNLSILKFLGFEQVYKNALTGLPMGGGKGGADFDPKGKSDNEIRKFCVAFMRELSRHIGPNVDVPAGDIGVSPREIGWMFGAYKALRNEWTGVLTGKGFNWGGSKIRPEATGYGLVYYVQHMIARIEGLPVEDTFKGKTVAISGSGNVAQYAALKVIELGGHVVSLSDSKGALVSTDGASLTPDEIHAIAKLKVERKSLDVAKVSSGFKYIEGVRPWQKVACDVALPCATQNEVSEEEAEHLVSNGVGYVAEGSNMGSTQEAIDVFEKARSSGSKKAFHGKAPLWYAPGKASNCGGVAVSGLEMAQNSARLQWSSEEVDAKLHDIMAQCYTMCETTGEKYREGAALPSLVVGANIAGFLKVADAMKQIGDVW